MTNLANIFAKKWSVCVIFFMAFAISLCFALYTQHIWEDYLITYRCSKNLAIGNGLVFTPGERVHAFTSPLNTLIPAALNYITFNTSDDLVIWLFRLVSCVAFAGAAVLLYQIAKAQSFKWLAMCVLIGLFITDSKIVDFSINGQEVGLMMFFMALMLHSLLVSGRRNALWLGIAWTGLAWTRPDACVYVSFIAGAFLIFDVSVSTNNSRLGLLKNYLIAGTIVAVLYLPWVAWAWWYYGSPIPHTITAKGFGRLYTLSVLWDRGVFFIKQIFTCKLQLLPLVLAPHYSEWSGWPLPILFCCRILAWVAALYWVIPYGRREARAVSLAFFFGCWYLTACSPSWCPWYIPNIAILAIFVLGHIVQQIGEILDLNMERIGRKLFWKVKFAFKTVAVAIPVLSCLVLLACGFQLRIQQSEVECGNRKMIGVWLHENAKSPNDTVFLEPLGYIGYYSQLKMLDWPGLCSPEVVEARRKTGNACWSKIISVLNPDWIVLRPDEYNKLQKEDPQLLSEHYENIKSFDVSDNINKNHAWIPGRQYVLGDSSFMIFKRLEDARMVRRDQIVK